MIYGVRLVWNVCEYLLGIDKQPQYILPEQEPGHWTERISQWWLHRWLLGRIDRPDVIDRLARHHLVRPIRHGARVVLPRADLEQRVLFEEPDE